MIVRNVGNTADEKFKGDSMKKQFITLSILTALFGLAITEPTHATETQINECNKQMLETTGCNFVMYHMTTIVVHAEVAKNKKIVFSLMSEGKIETPERFTVYATDFAAKTSGSYIITNERNYAPIGLTVKIVPDSFRLLSAQ